MSGCSQPETSPTDRRQCQTLVCVVYPRYLSAVCTYLGS